MNSEVNLYYLFADIRCVCSLVQNPTNLGASSVQVPYKFWTSSDKFHFETVREREWIVSFLSMDILLCMYLGTKLDKFWSKLRTSSVQVPYKFRTSFVFKLASCPHLHRNSWDLHWTNSSCPKNKLSASCPELSAVGQLSDKFLAIGQVSLLVAAHHAGARLTNIISLIGRHIAKLFVAISPNCLLHWKPTPQQ
jgi:hypothetical protein